MIKRVNYLWRLFATGGSFTVFYFCSLVMITIILPIFRLAIRNSALRNKYVRWIINKYFILFIHFMVFIGVIRIEMHGAEQLKNIGNRLVIANHPSYLDIVILLSLVPNACCIVNGNLLSNLFIGLIVSSAGFVSNNADSAQVIDDCVEALNQGSSLIIFPEGTRSTPDRTLKFHRGFAHMALISGVDIQPVIIRCEPSLLAKGVPWHKIPEQPAKFRIDVKRPIKATDMSDINEPAAIASRKMVKYLEFYYSKEIGMK